jgi:methionyl-tRNA synthetase
MAVSEMVWLTIASILPLLIVIGIWEAVWKAIAMWKSARNNQLAWYVCLFIFNTAGILPILYIFFFQRKRK